MSYILDALKKVENEKARRAKNGAMSSMSGDLFQERVARASSRGIRKIMVVIVLVALITFTATWFALKGTKKQDAVTPRLSAPNQVAIQAVTPNPPPVQAPVQPLPPPAGTAPAPLIMQQARVEDAEHTGRTKKVEKKLQVTPQQHINSVQTIPAPADIKVSGIAWQDERAARRVVINGFLLKEGASVSGAKIMEIHQDRVRFTSPAGIFDVRMDATTLSGAPK